MRTLGTMLAVLVLLVWATGCSEQALEPSATDGLNLTDEFGGYTATAEKPAFGDETLLAEEEEEQEVDDPILASPAADSIINDPMSGIFRLRIVWGRLELDTTVTELTDWSGSLSVTRGAEVVRRLIRFEEGQDYLLERTDRRLVEWVSYTSVHNDGIVVDLYIPPPRPIMDTIMMPDSMGHDSMMIDTIWPDPATVTFETGPYTRTFTLAELAALDTVVELEDGNAIAFHGLRIPRTSCRRGFLYGEWSADEEGGARFRGMFTNRAGDVIGFVKGHAGTDDDGRRVLFGKWISRDGRFEGFLRGSWAPHPNRHGNMEAFQHAGGRFRGVLFNADRAPIGEFRGRYFSAPWGGQGFFQARWRLNCPPPMEPPEDDPFADLDDGF